MDIADGRPATTQPGIGQTLVWDNLNTHISVRMRRLIASRDWLTVVRLPAYAPDLNPTEGVRSWMADNPPA